MHRSNGLQIILLLGSSPFFSPATFAQSSGSAGTIHLVVLDQTGGVVPDAIVEIHNPVSRYRQSGKADAAGEFRFLNVPPNPYHLVVSKDGFQAATQDVDVRSSVPIELKITLKAKGVTETVTVEASAADLLENDPTAHTDVDRNLFDRLPLESQASSVSSLVTLATPGVVADSNGLFHGLGDHAENSFSVDGQPITDQQSKVFSNQIPADSIQSLEVISGAPPAEFGDKTSLVIKVTTRSGFGVTQPTGRVTASYGTFGSVTGGFNIAFGGRKWGNYVSASGLNTGRFLDPPEFRVMHAKGNQQDVFDRVDYQLGTHDTFQVNIGYTRSWFQTPNSFDTQAVAQDQRTQVKTHNIASTWTHLTSSSTVFTVGAFVRSDRFNYYPSGNPFADLPETFRQLRKLTNAGLRSDVSYVKGIHNLKAGVTFQHTFLTENFAFGVTDPALNPVCFSDSGLTMPVIDRPDLRDPAMCMAAGFFPNTPDPGFLAALVPFDLMRGGGLFAYHGHADIKQVALYIQDTIRAGNWAFNLGIRGDLYRGIVSDSQAEPRLGIAYNIKKTGTVLRVSYARVQETPFNENLVLASTANGNPVISAVVGPSIPAPIRPGQRNQFNAGFQQAFGKYLVVDAEYLWKYTHNGFDFSVLGNTPTFFPIAWHNSKIDGVSARVSLPNFHGLTAFAIFGHVNARFFFPQVGGLGVTQSSGATFRIDHDQAFQQTTHLQYQPWKTLPWIAFNWRYDSGLVASNPNLVDFPTALGFLDADQQAAVGLFCGNLHATLANPLSPSLCAGKTPFGAALLNIPLPGKGDVDHNPTRVAPRNLLDASVGDDNLFHGDRYKWSLRFTVINLTNKVALYNFLSTFSGTHFVTPRTYTAQLGFHF